MRFKSFGTRGLKDVVMAYRSRSDWAMERDAFPRGRRRTKAQCQLVPLDPLPTTAPPRGRSAEAGPGARSPDIEAWPAFLRRRVPLLAPCARIMEHQVRGAQCANCTLSL